jgi:CheY-like chemotaxis protein
MESLGPHQILFVEADPANAKFAEKLLSGWGLHVSVAKNREEAIELTKTNIFDLILMSLHLGDIDGYETARIIRRLGDQFQQVPIIGHGDVTNIDTKDNVLTDLIKNLSDQTELYNKLKNHLDKSQPEVVMANLDRCTDGDVEFRKELAQLLANNIIELMTNLEKAIQQKDANIFVRAVHKTKTTLSILNDTQLFEQINMIQTKLKEGPSQDLNSHAENLKKRCDRTIHILNELSHGTLG